MSREVTSEQLSIREGVDYDEVFGSSHEPDKGSSYSLERERQPNLLMRKLKVMTGKIRKR